MIHSNYHTHTYRCGHASGSDEEYVLSAIKHNIKTLGFSDHGPFEDKDYGFRMKFSEFNDYLLSIDSLKEKYKDKIKLLKSVEIEFFPHEISFYEKLLTKYNLDYLLLGQHMYYKNNNLVIYDIINDSSYFLDYANSLKEGMNTKLFKMIAHPDFFGKFMFPWDYNCEKATDIIIDAALMNNCILEINANGIRKGLKNSIEGKRYEYPHSKFWEVASKSGVKVTVNSDCHNPLDLYDDSLLKAYELAKKWNVNLCDFNEKEN